MERRFYSPREISEYTGAHIMTVYDWIARGEVPSCRIGRKILVDKRLLDAVLAPADPFTKGDSSDK